jgi:hypothetical protein
MLNGIYHTPTVIFFGKGWESRVGEEVSKLSGKVLLHYGGESFKKYGLYDKVTASLKVSGISYAELGGVKTNPRASLVYEGIKLCRNENIDFILAVGGGSVIDSAKAIGIGVPWEGDFFDFFEGRSVPQKSIRTATILTIPGSGSESNSGAIITHEEKELKLGCADPSMFPVFSILNPEVTCTLSNYYTSCGIIDAISHVFERYFTNTPYVDCTDRICEGLIATLMKYAVLVKDDPYNYDIRAEIMWACKLAHDNTSGFGRKQDWSTHIIAHELGAIYDIPHGAIISVIFPTWMKYVYHVNTSRFTQFAERIFNEQSIAIAINKYKQFLKTLGMPENLRELGINDMSDFKEISKRCVRNMQSGTIGNFTRLSPEDILNILKMSFQENI